MHANELSVTAKMLDESVMLSEAKHLGDVAETLRFAHALSAATRRERTRRG
jgi:hypothetical protein